MIRGLTRRLSLQSKILIALLGISLSAVLWMTALTNRYYTEAVTQEFQTIAREAAQRLDHHLDYYFQQLVKSTHVISADPVIQQWFHGEDNHIGSQASQVQQVLGKYVLTGNSEVLQVYLVSSDGRIVTTSPTVSLDLPYIKMEPWFDLVPDKEYEVVSTHLTHMPSRKGYPVLSLVIPIYDTSTIKRVGKIVLDIKLDEVDSILNSTHLGDTGVFFYEDGQRVVYYPMAPAWWGKEVSATGLADWHVGSLKQNTSTLQDINGTHMLIAKIRSNIGQWDMYAAVPLEQMSGGLRAAGRSTSTALILVAMTILIAAPLLSGTLIRPIRRLKLLMQKVAHGDLEVRAEFTPGRDEVQQLNNSFNQMVVRLKELIRTVTDLKTKEMQYELSQKEALIRALNNQINPHLLYNTLDIIKSLAFFEQVPVIERISQNLADVYRYHAHYSDREVTLSEEIKHVRKYLEIVHVRFPIHFQSKVVVNERYNECKIVKLTLQPIVENAVKYAVEAKSGRAAIFISAYRENDDLLIEIADNGPGIDPGIMEKLQRGLEDVHNDLQGHYLSKQELGLINVHARLYLQYGERYGITLHSFPERGAVVTIRVPFSVQSEDQRLEK